MLTFWTQALSSVILCGLVSLLIYAATDLVTAALTTCALLLGWTLFHLWHLSKLLQWGPEFPVQQVPSGWGAWDDAYALIYRRMKVLSQQQTRLAHSLIGFRNAAQALPDGVVSMDGHQHIEWANGTAVQHLGIRLPQDVGQNILNLLRVPAFVQYIGTPNSWEKPLIIRDARGSGRILSLQLLPYGDRQVLLLSRDVTQIEKLETMRRDFVANVSHELNTPLTVMSGFVETVHEMPLEPAQREHYWSLIREQTTRMQRIVSDLLTLSQLESTQVGPTDENVDIHALIQRIARDAHALSNHRHRIVTEIDENLNLVGSEHELHCAFSNLVNNAVRYTPNQGSITLKWDSTPNGCAQFSVTDTGIGIEPQHISRLTERFYRVDRGRSRETGGTGLGLAIVKHVLTRHDGQLQISSKPGQGSTFSVIFPSQRAKQAQALDGA